MLKRLLYCLLILLTCLNASTQKLPKTSCGQKIITEKLFRDHPEIKVKNDRIEALLANYNRQRTAGRQKELPTGGVLTLPVVVHIIHNNGVENISDAQVMQGIRYLNEAFANTGNYSALNGSDTRIQFCMAQRGPGGKATNGITRDVSVYTVMGGPDYYSDDLNVKNLNRWNPECYINIWLVNSIPGDVVGYAYLPSAAGTNVDGIVMEAAYFGSSPSNDVVIIHEMGHYLGLYHTFEGGCTNNDCITDGDKICDTPPDQSTASVSCNVNMNSCTTDVLSGFSTDQNDLKEDFLDYGNFDCMKIFTAGQSDRMNWFVQNVRYSLQNCKSCLPPCNSPVVAAFSSSTKSVQVGVKVNFTNQSVNANNYDWYVDGTLMSATTNFSWMATSSGVHIVMLVAKSNNTLCDDGEHTDTINVTCPVKAGFNTSAGIITMGQTVDFTNTSANASAYTWKINGVTKSSSANFTSLFSLPGIYTVTLVASAALCSDSVSSRLSVYDSTGAIPPNLCKQITFQKKYIDNSEVIYDVRPVKDSGYIMGGLYFVPGVDAYGGPLAAKLNQDGSIQWAKYIMPYSRAQIQRIKETSDGSYIATGLFYEIVNSNLITKTLLLKLDKNGNLLWAKKFGIVNSNGEKGLDITETKDGGYAFCGSTNDDSWKLTNWMVCKTDADGNITWSKKFDANFYERAYGIIANEDTLIVTGIRTVPTGPRSEIVVTKLKASDGKVIQSKFFDVANRSVETTSIFKIPGGYMVGAHSIADGFYYADMDIVVLQLDENLNVVRAGRIASDIFASVHGGFSPTSDGGFIALQDGPNWSITKQATQIMVYKISSQWQLEWSKQFPLNLEEGQLDFCVNGILPTADKGYILGENYENPSITREMVRIIKTDNEGNTPGCDVPDFPTQFITPVVATNNFTWPSEEDIKFDNPSDPSIPNPEVKEAQLTEVQRCATSDCNYIKINGKDSVCNINDTLTYFASRNSECTSSIQWQGDTSKVTIISAKDSSLKVIFKMPGKVKLYARIVTACIIVQDSMNIFISNSNDGIYLGPDIQLCKQSTVRLSAGNGFRSYKWNDGSVDSTLTAYHPGRYYVTANDYCGNYYSDTIDITLAPDVALNIGPDRIKCDNDSITISAPGSFEKYIWSPDYNINTTSSNSVKVWPDVDTTYTVTVQKNFSCTVIDSVHIMALKSQPINIGNDTSFCYGGFKILRAPEGFAGYTWQDGSTNKTFTASEQGLYWVHALNNNGCLSKDTMEIKSVYPLPPLNLGRDGKICAGTDNILNAGSGFASYLWQDGTTQSTFTAKDTGKYWVTIIDNNNCINSDTIIITGFNPTPQGFLNSSIEICDNAVTELRPLGKWDSYLWSNGTIAPSLTISSSGLYWLQVTNAFGCKGKDSINVFIKQDCPKVIYFPNAFTPNNDGRNDVFKPTAGAPLEKYYLAIYNRWGQKIFETHDILNGWDGKFKGNNTDAATFIWYASYKFYGDSEKNEKGVLVLIR